MSFLLQPVQILFFFCKKKEKEKKPKQCFAKNVTSFILHQVQLQLLIDSDV